MPMIDSGIMPSIEQIRAMYRKIEQNEHELKQFEEQLKKLLSGDKEIANSPLLVGKTPASLAICGADENLNMTITKKVIDKIMAPEVRDENGKRTRKSGHFLSEEQVVQALDNLKNPIMVLEGSKDNSLVAITDIKDDKGQQILVSVNLSTGGTVDDVNRISSAYGREGFAEYLNQQVNEKHTILAFNRKKTDELVHSIGVDFPKEDTIISFDDSIAYTTENVKYPATSVEEKADMSADTRDQYSQSISETVTRSNDSISKSDVDVNYQNRIHNPVLASKASKLEVKIARIEDNNAAVTNKIADNKRKIEVQQARIEDAQKTKEYCKELLDTTALPKPVKMFFTAMMNRQDKVIEGCNNRIAKSTDKNAVLSGKISENEKAIAKHRSKIEQLQKIDTFLSNMHSKEGRRENFVQTISELRNWSIKRTQSKLEKVEDKIAKKELALSKAVTSTEKVQLRNQLAQLDKRKAELEEKLEKLTAMSGKLDKLSALPEQQADEVVKVAAENIEAALEQTDTSDTEKIVVTILNETDKTIDNLDEIVSKIVEEFRKQQAEQQKEQTVPEKSVQQEEPSQQQNENKAYINALCSFISDTFAANYNPERHILNTNAVLTELSEKCNFDDVKSVIAAAVLDRHLLGESKGKEATSRWAVSQPLSDRVKSFIKEQGTVPFNIQNGEHGISNGIKTSFFDVFAKRVGEWEQSRQAKDKSVLSRKDITQSAAKLHEQQPKANTQEKSAKHNKNNQSL